VGFHMYSELLAEAVTNLRSKYKGESKKRLSSLAMPTVSLDLPSYLDEKIFNEEERLDFYRRLSETTTLPAVYDLADELKDRSAIMPRETQNLLLASRLRVVSASKGISSIHMRQNEVVVTAHDGIIFNSGFLCSRFSRGIKAGRGTIILDIKILGKNWPQVLEDVIKAI